MGHPAFIAKKELLDIPLFGWAARWMDTISVDRKKGKDALPAMMDEARAALGKGCRVIIFPEGTRRAPARYAGLPLGDRADVSGHGCAGGARRADLGALLGAQQPRFVAGDGAGQISRADPAGLPGDEFLKTLIARIETETDAMVLEDARKGLARPISPRLRARLNELEAKSGASS